VLRTILLLAVFSLTTVMVMEIFSFSAQAKERKDESVKFCGSTESQNILIGMINYCEDFLIGKNEAGLIPLLGYEEKQYLAFPLEILNQTQRSWFEPKFVSPEKAKAIQELFENKNFWLYQKGSLVGIFKSNTEIILDFGQPCLVGNISWKVAKNKTEEEMEKYPIIALSQPIEQPFWPEELKLDSKQSESLERIIKSDLEKAFQKFKVNPAHFDRFKDDERMEIMDLNRDGNPEVYIRCAMLSSDINKFEGEVITISLLLTFEKEWKVMKEGSAHWINDTVEGLDFNILPIDIDGSGIAHLILTRNYYDSWEYYLYKTKKDSISEILKISEGNI